MLSGPLESVGGALRFVGVSAEGAAVGVRALTIAAGVIGAIIAVATLLYSAHAESVRQDQAAVNSLTDALRQSNGAIDENIRQMTVKALTDSGALATAKEYGINLALVTNAALGYAGAQAQLNTEMTAAQAKEDAASAARPEAQRHHAWWDQEHRRLHFSVCRP